MNTDVENRLHHAFAGVLGKDSALNAVVAGRIYRHADKSHKAVYPCVTVAVPSCYPFGPREGWYRATVMLNASTYLHDDQDGSRLMQLAGIVRGILQSGNLESDLCNAPSAKTYATELTVVEAVIDEAVEITDEPNVRSIGMAVAVVARPSTGQNNG